MMLRICLILLIGSWLSACDPVHVLNSTITDKGYKVVSDLSFGQHARQKMDLYLPEKINAETPVVVFVHGGSWRNGSKLDYLFAAQGLTSLGYIVAVPDYRVYPEISYPVFLEDNAKAVVWVYKNIRKYGGNSENLYLMGHSAGAYNVMMIALDQRYLKAAKGSTGWIRGVIALAGPYDFLPITDPNIIPIFASERNGKMTQPINYVRARAPRTLLMTGSDDDDVDAQNSRTMYEALKKRGNDVTLKEYKGVGHYGIILGISNSVVAPDKPIRDDIKAFIENR